MLDIISNSPVNLLAKLQLKDNPPGLWLISAPSGAGKTTLCSRIISQARDAGLTVGGLICPAVFESGEKTAIDQVDIASGERRNLGWRIRDGSDNTVGCWKFDVSVLDWGNEILSALGDEDLIVIDEIGPLELVEGKGYLEAMRLLDGGRYRMAVVVVRPALLQAAQERWPHAGELPVTMEEE